MRYEGQSPGPASASAAYIGRSRRGINATTCGYGHMYRDERCATHRSERTRAEQELAPVGHPSRRTMARNIMENVYRELTWSRDP